MHVSPLTLWVRFPPEYRKLRNAFFVLYLLSLYVLRLLITTFWYLLSIFKHLLAPSSLLKRDKALELYAGKLWITLKIRKPFNLKTWKQKSVEFGFMIRPLINPLNICWTFDMNTLIPMISLDYFKSPLFYPDHTLIFNRMKRPKSKLECDLFFNLILISFENQKYF
jgi:hypothetical protein